MCGFSWRAVTEMGRQFGFLARCWICETIGFRQVALATMVDAVN